VAGLDGPTFRFGRAIYPVWKARSTYLAVSDRDHAATVQYDVVTMMKFIGLVLGALKDHAVHGPGRAVVSATLDLHSVAPFKILSHFRNLKTSHTARQGR